MTYENEMREFTLMLTKEDVFTLSYWIESGIFDIIRNDEDTDNIQWVHRWIHNLERLENLFKEDNKR